MILSSLSYQIFFTHVEYDEVENLPFCKGICNSLFDSFLSNKTITKVVGFLTLFQCHVTPWVFSDFGRRGRIMLTISFAYQLVFVEFLFHCLFSAWYDRGLGKPKKYD